MPFSNCASTVWMLSDSVVMKLVIACKYLSISAVFKVDGSITVIMLAMHIPHYMILLKWQVQLQKLQK